LKLEKSFEITGRLLRGVVRDVVVHKEVSKPGHLFEKGAITGANVSIEGTTEHVLRDIRDVHGGYMELHINVQ